MEGWCNRIDNCNLESSGSAIRVGDDDNANNVGECSRSHCVFFPKPQEAAAQTSSTISSRASLARGLSWVVE